MAILVDIPVGQDFKNPEPFLQSCLFFRFSILSLQQSCLTSMKVEAVSINVIDLIDVQNHREIVVINDWVKVPNETQRSVNGKNAL